MRILCIRPKKSAVYEYRMTRPLTPLGARFRETILRKNEKIQVGKLAERLKKQGDVWVIKYISKFETLDLIYSMRKMVDVKIVVDIDDDIWQTPLDSAAFGDPKKHANMCIMVAKSIEAADWVTVATDPLKGLLMNLSSNIEVLPNYINPKDWEFKRKKHDKVRIGWVYSPTHWPDVDEVQKALEEVYEKYQDKIEIVIFGTTVDLFKFPITKIAGVKYDKYPQVFTEAGIDISIAPLRDNEFNKCKSNIKWLESSMAGAAFIGSKVYPYEHSVKHGKTGYLAKDKNQWVKHLSYLIENPDKRKELVENARKEVLKKYSSNKKWEEFYKSLEK